MGHLPSAWGQALRSLLRGPAPAPFDRGRFQQDLDVVLKAHPELGQGGVVLEVGAGSGAATWLLAARVQPPWTVIAFEPEPRAAQALRQAIAERGLRGQVQLFESAIGVEETRMALRLDTRSGRDHHQVLPSSSADARTHPIIGVRLDGHLERASLTRVGLVVVDVAGCEPEVLDSLSGFPLPVPLFVAYRPAQLREAGHDPEAILEALHHQREVSWVEDGRVKELDLTKLAARLSADQGTALFCSPRSVRSRLPGASS